MRPYAFHKDQDGQYVETGISQANVIQPSPLALLAATCSKIGQTVPENARSYSQGKSSALAETRSCADQFKSSPFVCLDRSSDSFKTCPPAAPANVQSPYFKVKQEESADYNQNFEDVRVCTNALHESRLRDKQRARATSGCGHKTRGYTSSCEHVVENHEFFASNGQPDCDQSFRNARLQSHEQQSFNSTSVVDQFGMPDHGFFVQNMSFSHSSSGVYENQAFQGSSLANLPAVTTACSMPNFEPSPQFGFSPQSDRQLDISASWSSSLRDIREAEVSMASKPSCMMYERSPHLHHMPPASQISSSTRHGLSHANTPVQLSLASTTPTVLQQQFFSQQGLSPLQDARTCQNLRGASSQPSQHVRSFPAYAPGPGDVKLNSFLQHPTQNFRSAAALNSSDEYSDSMYQSQVHHDQQQKWRYSAQFHLESTHHHPSPTGQVGDVMAADAVSQRMHGDVLQIGDYSSSTCSSPPPTIEVHSPSVLPGGPGMLHHAEAQGQAFSEYQYQQQQMFYARDNRRPRRIACTCPNCRDGENKGIATKDGKQRKLHVCHVPGCGKIYGKTSHLRAHLRWHAGERPFACNWLFCNKRFTRSDELQRHRRTHTGDKRFQCRTCLKKFMRSDHLSKHMKTHLMQQKTSKTKNDSDTSSDGVSASTDNSESGDLGTQLKEILSDSHLPAASS